MSEFSTKSVEEIHTEIKTFINYIRCNGYHDFNKSAWCRPSVAHQILNVRKSAIYGKQCKKCGYIEKEELGVMVRNSKFI